jgi:hypothetical protein
VADIGLTFYGHDRYTGTQRAIRADFRAVAWEDRLSNERKNGRFYRLSVVGDAGFEPATPSL